jgi:hypothetical protein
MTITSTANTPVRTVTYPAVELTDRVLKITGSGDATQLQEIANKIRAYRQSHPEITNIEVDISQVRGQTPEKVILLLLSLKKKNNEETPSITGLTDIVLQSTVVKPLLTQIQMSGGGRRYVPLGIAKSPEPANTCFSLAVESNNITFTFSPRIITGEDTASLVNTVKKSTANVIIDLQNCASLPTDAVLDIISLHKLFSDGRFLKIIVKTGSNPEGVINTFIAKHPHFTDRLGKIVSM